MNQKWIGQAVVRLYPVEVRAEKGQELVGTLLDAGEESLGAFLRELLSLSIGGLLARSRLAQSAPVGQVANEALRWAAVIGASRFSVSAFVLHARIGQSLGSAPSTLWIDCAPVLILALFLRRHDRAAGVIGLAWCVVEANTHPDLALAGWIYILTLPIVGFAVMAARSRTQLHAGRGLVWVPLLAWAALCWHGMETLSGAGYLVPMLIAVPFVTTEPAMVFGMALVWSASASRWFELQGQSVLLAVVLIACTPAALTLVAISRRALRPQ